MKDLTETQKVWAAIVTIAFMVAFIYGMYWIFKTVSYLFFYEDMVIDTIKEVVDPKYLLIK